MVSRQKVDDNAFQKERHAESLVNKLTDMSPECITPEELTIQINGTNAKIVGINKITEYARGLLMYGYCVQVLKPENSNLQPELKYDQVTVTLHCAETGEWGKGEAFVKRDHKKGTQSTSIGTSAIRYSCFAKFISTKH